MKPKILFGLIWLLVVAAPPRFANGQGEGYERSVLSLPLFPAPLVLKRAPLTRGLGELGAAVRGSYVLFGVELRSNGRRGVVDWEPNGVLARPAVSVNLQPVSTLGDALRQILRQLPGYRFEVVSPHMINIYPAGAKDDPTDVLNIRVARFDVAGVPPGDILSRPQDFVPQLKSRLTPGKTGPPQPGGAFGDVMSGMGPTVTLHLRNVTVRQILNATSEAMDRFPPNYPPLGWLYTFRPDPNSPVGGEYCWTFLFSAPSDWKPSSGAAAPKRPTIIRIPPRQP